MTNVETYKVIIAQFHKMDATTRNRGGLSAHICMNTDGILFSEVRPYIEDLSELGFFDTIVKPKASTKYIIVSYGNDKQSATSSQDLKRLEKF